MNMKYSLIGVLAIFAILGGAAFHLDRSVSSHGQAGPAVSITIPTGAGVRKVADVLYDQHVIDQRWHWNVYMVLTGRRSSILAGTYLIPRNSSIRDMASIVTSAPTNDKEVTVKILEGLTAKEIAAELEQKGVLPAADFLAAIEPTAVKSSLIDASYDFLADKPATASLEGYLFPDTYRFFKKDQAKNVVKKFLDNFGRKYTPAMRQVAKQQGHTIFQEVIMASILEVELTTEVDRKMGADIFWRRLGIGMALNSDATINYALGKSTLNISLEDLKVDSLYNTYKHRGLPPGPINNPSLSALRAAANPTPNEYWYYLSAPNGQTIYGKTLEEHNQNKQQYLR